MFAIIMGVTGMFGVYGASILREGDDFVVSMRDLEEVCTSGGTLAEALALAQDAADAVIARRMERDLGIPLPTPLEPGEYSIALPAQTTAKALLYNLLKESGVSKSELARRMSVQPSEVARILNPRHRTHMATVDAAMRALGYYFTFGAQTADPAANPAA